MNILKKSWTLKPNHLSGNIFYHYITRVTGVYMAYIFNRHSGGKASQIDCFESNLRSFECFEALWLLMDPSNITYIYKKSNIYIYIYIYIICMYIYSLIVFLFKYGGMVETF